MKLAIPLASGFAVALGATLAQAQVPQGYPADYAAVADAAKKEGKVVVYGTTDAAAANFLVKDFEALYGIKVEYNDLNSTELYNRFIAEAAAGQGTADVTWSSAQDLQIKLANDGYAVAYKSPESAAIPSWANYKDMAYGVTYEPVAFVYNKRLVPAEDVPKSHADLLKLLTAKPDAYKGKVTAYDPERSGVGYLFFTQDDLAWKQAWDLFKAFGKTEIKLYTSAGAMIERVTSGEHLIGYGVFGSYALARSKKDPNMGIVLPSDYTLIASRVAFLSSKAKNPNAGKLFLDYLLSKRGQTIIANAAELYSLRDDVQGEATVSKVREQVGNAIRPIKIDADLASNLDATKRLRFLKQWQTAMKGN
jgi:iron(III) transport system substrate-binding protein